MPQGVAVSVGALEALTPEADRPGVKIHPSLIGNLRPIFDLLYRQRADGAIALRDDTVEVSVNGPDDVWVERTDGGYSRAPVTGIDKIWAEDLCVHLANIYGQSFDPMHRPLLSSSLPGGHRFQAVLGANVRSGIAIGIRLSRESDFSLSDFGVEFERTEASCGNRVDRKADLHRTDHPIGSGRDLEQAVSQGMPILVSGGTNAGKTTFLRTLMPHIPASKRVVTVEDVPELPQSHENFVGLIADDAQTGTKADYTDLIKALLRLNPSVAIGGELSIENAMPLYRILISGHSSFMSTIHAGDPVEALDAWFTNLTMSKGAAAAEGAMPGLVRALGRIVQLDQNRQVTDIVRPVDLPLRDRWLG